MSKLHKQIYVISSNQGKIKELTSLLSLDGWQISNIFFDLPEIQSLDILEISRYKCQAALKQAKKLKLKGFIVIDDTALEIKALNSLPGALVKWFLQVMSLNELARLKLTSNSEALAVCVLGLANIQSQQTSFFKAAVQGQVKALENMDTKILSFGWDGIFYPHGYEQSYANMSGFQKNQISHRAKAAQNLVSHLKSQHKDL